MKAHTPQIEALKTALRLDPLDDLLYQALADALEEAGRHAEARRYRSGKPSIPDVLAYFVDYPWRNCGWGSLHVVLEEGNVEDHNVRDCASYCWGAERHSLPGGPVRVGGSQGQVLAKILLRMSKTQRGKIGDLARRM